MIHECFIATNLAGRHKSVEKKVAHPLSLSLGFLSHVRSISLDFFFKPRPRHGLLGEER